VAPLRWRRRYPCAPRLAANRGSDPTLRGVEVPATSPSDRTPRRAVAVAPRPTAALGYTSTSRCWPSISVSKANVSYFPWLQQEYCVCAAKWSRSG
jgi:hypothetical protein